MESLLYPNSKVNDMRFLFLRKFLSTYHIIIIENDKCYNTSVYKTGVITDERTVNFDCKLQ